MSRRSTLPPHPPPLSHPLTQLKSIHSLLFIILSLFIFIFIYLGGQLCPHPPPVSHSPALLLLFIILSLFIFIIISRRSTLPPPLHQNPISIEIHSFIDSELVSYKRTLSHKYNYEFPLRTLLVTSLDLINVYKSYLHYKQTQLYE